MSNAQPTVYTEAEPIARKQHICCECKKTIERDQKYTKITGIWEGRGLSFKICSACMNVRRIAEHMNKESDGLDDEGPPLGMLYEWIEDAGFDKELARRMQPGETRDAREVPDGR